MRRPRTSVSKAAGSPIPNETPRITAKGVPELLVLRGGAIAGGLPKPRSLFAARSSKQTAVALSETTSISPTGPGQASQPYKVRRK